MIHLRDRVTRLGLLSFFFWLCAASSWSYAQSADCEPGWLPAFGPPSGLDGNAYALQGFDDELGGGPALYVAGDFDSAGAVAVSNIARWDGIAWSALGSPGSGLDGAGSAMAVFDDGSGPALYVGGDFNTAGGVGAGNIARWDGLAWSNVGGGLSGIVRSLAVHDDGQGGGPALYVGGSFPERIKRWTGSQWQAVGEGFGDEGGDEVRALLVHDDGQGDGPQLYAGGNFKAADGAPGNRIARWDGVSWNPLAAGVGAPLGGAGISVYALATFDDGGGAGPRLYAGGTFSSAGPLHTNNVACWDGASWSLLGPGADNAVLTLAAFDAGTGTQLYAGGAFATAGGLGAPKVARWDGGSWSQAGDGFGNSVHALRGFDPPGPEGPRLFAGGSFTSSGAASAGRVARFDGTSWTGLSAGFGGSIRAAAVFDDASGDGEALYVTGPFHAAGGLVCIEAARWDGSVWSPLATLNGVNSFVVHDNGRGGGPALYAGGSSVQRWDGAAWVSLGAASGGVVTALASFDPPGPEGAMLYAGGTFNSIGGTPVTSIARWDGATWSDFGTLMNDHVASLAVVDEVGGPALYVGGKFSFVSGVFAARVARWDGTAWSALASGLGGAADVRAECFASFDDGRGDGPALYVGGSFTLAGGAPASHLARWDGAAWSSAGLGVAGANPVVEELAVFDDGAGSGPRLFLGGSFDMAGGVPAANVACWDGNAWSPLGGGAPASVRVLVVHDDGAGAGPLLWVGGSFKKLPDTDDAYLGTWGGCTASESPWTDLGFALAGVAGLPQLVGTGPLLQGSPGSLTLSQAAPSAPAQLLVSPSGNPTPFKGGVLVPLPVALLLTLGTSPAGALNLSWPAWPGGLSGLSLYFQYAIVDAAAVHGLALSNALRADVP